ncbi:MAG: pseudouridine synthase [Planctomycetota bacterium]
MAKKKNNRRAPAKRNRRNSTSSAQKKSSGKSSSRGAPEKGRRPTSTTTAKRRTANKRGKTDDGKQRLQRVMAAAGIASRRECEIIIQEGRVEVDGNVVVELGHRVDPEKQEIYVDAERIRIEPLQYFALNKPPGIVSTNVDPAGRPRVIDLIRTQSRVYNVGRLDKSSEGLILVTNDGTLAHRLTHPRFGIEKKYHVQVDGRPTPAQLKQLREGIYIAEGKVRASNIRYLKRAKSGSWLEIILDEGRNREIRRMLAAVGHKVRVLKRVSIGPLKLGELPLGAHRPLTKQEIKRLQTATANPVRKKRKSAPRKNAKATSAESSSSTSNRTKSSTQRNPKTKSSRGSRTDSTSTRKSSKRKSSLRDATSTRKTTAKRKTTTKRKTKTKRKPRR